MLVLLVIHDFLFFGIKLLFVSLNPHLSSGLGQQKNFEFLYYSFIHDHLCGWHWWRLHTFILSLTLGKSSKINKRKKALKNSKLETSQMMYYAQNFFFLYFEFLSWFLKYITTLGASFMFGRALTSTIWGLVADRRGRKPVIIMGIIAVLVNPPIPNP